VVRHGEEREAVHGAAAAEHPHQVWVRGQAAQVRRFLVDGVRLGQHDLQHDLRTVVLADGAVDGGFRSAADPAQHAVARRDRAQ
jgi:hypothetical protein